MSFLNHALKGKTLKMNGLLHVLKVIPEKRATNVEAISAKAAETGEGWADDEPENSERWAMLKRVARGHSQT